MTDSDCASVSPETAFVTWDAMRALFSATRRWQALLDVEAALARAQARVGLTPAETAAAIERACDVAAYDTAAMARETAATATPVVPLVRHLKALVGPPHAQHVHRGATSQDIMDTATMLQMRDGLRLLGDELRELAVICARLADGHRRTVMVGRTVLQHAVPVTFGLKAAYWLEALTRRLLTLDHVQDQALAAQLGGAAGTLASLGADGLTIMPLFAEEVGLPASPLPWHTDRGRVAEIVTWLGVTAGSCGKIAGDVILLAQSDVDEVSTAAAGTSSAMPHKRNPVDAVAAVAAARLAMATVPVVLGAVVQEHERSAGAWQAEWRAVPDAFLYTGGTVHRTRAALDGLHVHADRMRANLHGAGDLVMAESLVLALASRIGEAEARQVVDRACTRARADRRSLIEVALGDAEVRTVLGEDALRHALEPSHYLGSADTFVDRALTRFADLGTGSAA